MSESKIARAAIDVDASAERVWAVLTKPEETAKYMFGCRTVSSWKVGEKLEWEGEAEGKKVVYVTGKILVLEPHRRFHYSVFDPNGTYRDEPWNYLTVTYDLEPRGNGVRLSVSQGDYSKVEDGEKRWADTTHGEGWGGLLKQIKAQAEAK